MNVAKTHRQLTKAEGDMLMAAAVLWRVWCHSKKHQEIAKSLDRLGMLIPNGRDALTYLITDAGRAWVAEREG